MRAPILVSRLRSQPALVDASLAAALVALALANIGLRWGDPVQEGYRAPDALLVVLAVGALAPVARRRRNPVGALVTTTVSVLISQALAYPDVGIELGLLIGAYSVAAHAQPRVSWPWGVAYVAVLSVWVVVGLLVDAPNASASAIVGTYLLYGTAWILGDHVRRRRERVAYLEERAAVLEREQALEEHQVRSRERAAIARELHDVVAHSMTVMVVQASGARRAMAKDPAVAAEALRTIEETGRASLVEMRRILGILRDSNAPDFAPQPSVARIAELAALEPGLAVQVVTAGTERELVPSVDVSAYRIVQEALTNVRKHAGPDARATVKIAYGDDELTVRVDDNGRGAMTLVSAHTTGSGHGITGMHERVAVCGGTLRSGPRIGGGWSVVARLPYAGAPQ